SIDDFSAIATLSDLRHLLVGGTAFDDADLAMVSAFPNLERLQLWGDEGISDLSPIVGLPLRELDVGGTSVTAQTPVHGMAGTLEVLYAYALGHDDAAIGFLEGFSNLTALWLDSSGLPALRPPGAHPRGPLRLRPRPRRRRHRVHRGLLEPHRAVARLQRPDGPRAAGGERRARRGGRPQAREQLPRPQHRVDRVGPAGGARGARRGRDSRAPEDLYALSGGATRHPSRRTVRARAPPPHPPVFREIG